MPGSAVMDTGTDVGVTMDIDGQPRPMRGGYDIGADECIEISVETIVNHLLGIAPFSAVGLMLGDLNGDGAVDIADVVWLINGGT